MVIKTINNMKLYKVISKDGMAQNGGNFDYNPYFPKNGKPGKWTPEVKTKKCKSGYHITNYWNMWINHKSDLVFEVECKDINEYNGVGVIDKYVSSSIKLIKKINVEFDQHYNTGYRNTGDRNTGDSNTGYRNTGDRNTGNWNTGYRNTGDRNTGDRNTGNWNTRDNNTGDRNTGDRNTGDSNTGYRNTGDRNTGDSNTGNWNTCDYETGMFNTQANSSIRIFNKYIDMDIWNKYSKPNFIYFDLKEDYNESFIKSFNETTKEDVKLLLKLPNFNYEVFEEISGITKKMIERKLK